MIEISSTVCRNGFRCSYRMRGICKFNHPPSGMQRRGQNYYIYNIEAEKPYGGHGEEKPYYNMKEEQRPERITRSRSRSPKKMQKNTITYRNRIIYGDSACMSLTTSRCKLTRPKKRVALLPTPPPPSHYQQELSHPRDRDIYNNRQRRPPYNNDFNNTNRAPSYTIARGQAPHVRDVESPICRHGPRCLYHRRGICRFSHPPVCRNGTQCRFRKEDKCKYFHPRYSKETKIFINKLGDHSSSDESDEQESIGVDSVDEDCVAGIVEEGVAWVHMHDSIINMMDRFQDMFIHMEFDVSSPSSPVHKEFICSRDKGDNLDVSRSGELFGRIEGLPEELRVEILRKMDLELILSLDLSPQLLRLVLHIPKNILNVDFWLANMLAEKDLGLINVPDCSMMFVSNYIEHDISEVEEGYCHMPLQVSDIVPCLLPGVYKVRILPNGVDLVKSGNPFLSSQCGSQTCQHGMSVEEWPMTMTSRGMVLDIQDRSDLAANNWQVDKIANSWRFPRDRGNMRGPVLVIATRQDFWTQEWTVELRRVYSRETEDLRDGWLELGTIRDIESNVVGYTVGGTCFMSFDPTDEAGGGNESYYSDLGSNFSVIRYRGEEQDEWVGLSLTGDGEYFKTVQDVGKLET